MQKGTDTAARVSGRDRMELTPATRALADAVAAAAAGGGDATSLLARLEQREDWREAYYGMSDDLGATTGGIGFLGAEGEHVRRTMTLTRVIRDDGQIGHVLEDGKLHAVAWTPERQPVHMGKRCVVDGMVEERVFSPLSGQWTMVQPASIEPAQAA